MAKLLDNTLILNYLSQQETETLVFTVSLRYAELPPEQFTLYATTLLETGEYLNIYRVNFNPPPKRSYDENIFSPPNLGANRTRGDELL